MASGRRTRGEAIWDEARDAAIADVTTALGETIARAEAAEAALAALVPELLAAQAQLDMIDTVALSALSDRISGIESAIGLKQAAGRIEGLRATDGGAAQLMDRGWIRMDDSAIAAALV